MHACMHVCVYVYIYIYIYIYLFIYLSPYTVDDINPALPKGPSTNYGIFLIMGTAGFISSTVVYRSLGLFLLNSCRSSGLDFVFRGSEV